MSKFARPLVLVIAIAALAGGAMTAQDRTKKSTDKKDVKGTVEYYEAGDGWRWKVTNGTKTIGMATKGYTKKEDAIKAIEDVKAILNAVKPTEGKATKKAKDKE
ncbi:MAG TPA: hypothetical protein VGJ05_10395 [Fimbriiglobus sp.]|jgi:uncharacterized protein YegP (UPF0339 family)